MKPDKKMVLVDSRVLDQIKEKNVYEHEKLLEKHLHLQHLVNLLHRVNLHHRVKSERHLNGSIGSDESIIL